MSFEICGVGTATPPFGVDQPAATEVAQSICCQSEEQRRLLTALYRRAGVDFRRSVVLDPPEAEDVSRPASPGELEHRGNNLAVAQASKRGTVIRQTFFEPAANADDCGPTTAQRMQMYERHAAQLAVQAAERALAGSELSAADITDLVTVSCTGFGAPGFDLALIRNFGMNPSVTRTHLGFMGCHGAINGLRVAQAYGEATADSRILLCAVELCTLHQQYGWHPERIVSNALFADGAAAVVGRGHSSGQNGPWAVKATASTVIPESADLMSWRVGDHGFEMSLSAEVPDTIRALLKPWVSGWLDDHGLKIDQVRSWAIHPGGPRILRAAGMALDLPDSHLIPSQRVLADFGNMSSPTVIFVLERLMQESNRLPCVMLAFGPGLSIEAALIV